MAAATCGSDGQRVSRLRRVAASSAAREQEHDHSLRLQRLRLQSSSPSPQHSGSSRAHAARSRLRTARSSPSERTSSMSTSTAAAADSSSAFLSKDINSVPSSVSWGIVFFSSACGWSSARMGVSLSFFSPGAFILSSKSLSSERSSSEYSSPSLKSQMPSAFSDLSWKRVLALSGTPNSSAYPNFLARFMAWRFLLFSHCSPVTSFNRDAAESRVISPPSLAIEDSKSGTPCSSSSS
mmetsp:Transcript_87813/g.183561  ORF Transcript_87813/g.183561 Transcript_87813/m.183561 type:complete len:238 (+) Transcript_87813:117-830(+)